jgi:carbon-monoxide dehydrogenase iron sulfur subunit
MKEIFVNIDRCLGCLSCEIACRVEHSLTKNIFTSIFELRLPKKRVFVQSYKDKNIPLQCRNCEDSPCIKVCPTGAMHKDERGITICDEEKCIGCFMCVLACPFGVISEDRKKVVKCDRCPDREIPACVEACPTKALTFEEVKDFSATKREIAARGVI